MNNISKLVLGNTSFNFYNISKKLLKLYILEMLLFTIVIILTVTNIIGLNLSIDFTGGTLYEVENINSQTLGDISEFSSNLELSVTRYESINDGDYYRFRTVEGSIEDENIVLNQISTFFGTPKSEIDFQRVGPTFGTEISNQGVRALLIFIAFIASIISIRYQFLSLIHI